MEETKEKGDRRKGESSNRPCSVEATNLFEIQNKDILLKFYSLGNFSRKLSPGLLLGFFDLIISGEIISLNAVPSLSNSFTSIRNDSLGVKFDPFDLCALIRNPSLGALLDPFKPLVPGAPAGIFNN